MIRELQDMKELVSLCKRRGFIFPGSDIYGGLANTFDYGPLGAELKLNLRNLWWEHFVRRREDVVGLDSTILLNPKVWEASGHLKNFSDPMLDCRNCNFRFRADHLVEEHLGEAAAKGKTLAELSQMIVDAKIKCSNCGKESWTAPRSFNLMFKTQQGVVEGEGTDIFLRPETAQGIFIDFAMIQESCRISIPFGVGQIGKSFRNEITPGNFTFRTREFEQMELEFFVEPHADLEWYAHWKEFCLKWLTESVGIGKDRLKLREHEKDELSHYSSATCDIEYNFPFGWGELWGIACRTDFDLKSHMALSGKDLQYHDLANNRKYIPWVIEPSLGLDRLLLAVLCNSYNIETLQNGEERTVLKFSPAVAPVKAAILPLSKKPELKAVSEAIFRDLLKVFRTDYDDTQSIGKRYRRQDEIGTPYCVTVDFQTLEDQMVTVRERDSMTQVRIAIADLKRHLCEAMKLNSFLN